MYLQVSLLQSLAYVIPVVLLWSSPCRAQAVAKCWVFSPDVTEATIKTDISTVSTVSPVTGQLLWSITARVTWDRPPSLEANGAYAVSVIRMPSFQAPKLCQIEERESVIETEEIIFTGLDFGFLYEFRVFVVNGTSLSKSLILVAKGFGTPDCFQATGDRTFCTSAEVQYAGAPIQPRLEGICLHVDTSLIQAHLSWEPPIQSQGRITAYKVQYSQTDAPAGTLPGVTTALPEPSLRGRVSHDLYNLTPDTSYTVLISAFVIQNDGFNEGLQVELNFQTTGTPPPVPICLATPEATTTTVPEPLPTTPKNVTPNTPIKKPTSPLPGNLNQVNGTTIPPYKTSNKITEPSTVQTPTTKRVVNRHLLTTLPSKTPESTTKGGVEERSVSSSKRAGIAVAACLVSLGIVCAIVLFVLHFVKERMRKTPPAVARPDTKGAQKGTKTATSPA